MAHEIECFGLLAKPSRVCCDISDVEALCKHERKIKLIDKIDIGERNLSSGVT